MRDIHLISRIEFTWFIIVMVILYYRPGTWSPAVAANEADAGIGMVKPEDVKEEEEEEESVTRAKNSKSGYKPSSWSPGQ